MRSFPGGVAEFCHTRTLAGAFIRTFFVCDLSHWYHVKLVIRISP